MTSTSKTSTQTKSGARRRGREFCLALLFQRDLAGLDPGRVFEDADRTLLMLYENWETDAEERRRLGAEIEDFGRRLTEQYFLHAGEIDAAIEELSHEWALSRMPVIDRNLLRLAITELIYCPDVPISAAINEAVELAKEYGTPESAKFVNGVLGTFVRQRELLGEGTEAADK